jgi:hypothetical protein
MDLQQQIAQVLQRMEHLGVASNGASTLIATALQDVHAACLEHGAAVSTSYGPLTRQVRARTRKRLEEAARSYFLSVSAAQDLVPPRR